MTRLGPRERAVFHHAGPKRLPIDTFKHVKPFEIIITNTEIIQQITHVVVKPKPLDSLGIDSSTSLCQPVLPEQVAATSTATDH
jgi:hypothetical protein